MIINDMLLNKLEIIYTELQKFRNDYLEMKVCEIRLAEPRYITDSIVYWQEEVIMNEESNIETDDTLLAEIVESLGVINACAKITYSYI